MRRVAVPLEDLCKLENLTIDEFSGWARISRASTYRAIRDGNLVARKIRGRTIVRREDALRFTAGSPL